MNFSYAEAVSRGWLDKSDVPAAARKSVRKAELEGEEQAELIAQFRAEFAQVGSLLIHIPNGGSRKNAFEGWRLKNQGVRAGVSDLLLPVARDGYHGLWIEFKAGAPHNAPVSAAQQEWLRLMREQGYAAEVCLGVTQAMRVLRTYLGATASTGLLPPP